MVDEMNADYVKFARSKGLSESRIMFTHVLRNALVYLARGFAATLLLAVMGSYFVENLWVIPGSGKLLIKSLQNGDLPLIQALVVVYAVLSMSAVLLGDLVTIMLDPRISLTKNK
jgi:ABC-type dipeptide/oligopeptide/nickel transport system permease component